MSTKKGTNQLGLFDEQPVTRGESLRRSAAAKREAQPLASDRCRQTQAVLHCLRSAGAEGLTRHEIAERLSVPLSSVCGRVNELLSEAEPVVFVAEKRRDGRSVIVARGLGGGGVLFDFAAAHRSHYDGGF